MSQSPQIDQAISWCFPQLDNLRFMRALYVEHSFKPHAHDYFVLGIIEAGVQKFAHGRSEHVTIPGKLIIINPEELHTGEAAVTQGFAYRALYPTVKFMQSLSSEFSRKTGEIPHFSAATLQDVQVYERLRRLHHFTETALSTLEIEEALTRFFVEFIHRHASNCFILLDYRQAHQAVLASRDYLEAHYAENVSLADLSRQVHITPYHLLRLFKRQVGIAPHKYLENLRIRHAERLLVSGMSIAEVAYSTGFSSQSHLSRTFKHFIGTSPAEFAKKRNIR
jgi:AraC-like DNA-binding protein